MEHAFSGCFGLLSLALLSSPGAQHDRAIANETHRLPNIGEIYFKEQYS